MPAEIGDHDVTVRQATDVARLFRPAELGVLVAVRFAVSTDTHQEEDLAVGKVAQGVIPGIS